MGGKSKQRVKNNARPSNSSRSADIVGLPGFVGFAAHSELGIVPLAPGFSTLAALPDSFDANISPEYQLVLRKMTKKDSMTKKKALQEFIDLINTHSLEENKAVIPLWPRLYQNLSTDPDHVIRELTQIALRALLSKCKRAVAPYLKQLVPQWLISQYDNYAPAANIATISFQESFAANADRTQEVFLHCQAEIFEKAEYNLTFQTAATLSSGKDLEAVEAEQKYHRAVVGSLKMLSCFIAKIDVKQNSDKLITLSSLLEKPKFWSFASSKSPQMRSAWFELLLQLLQSDECRALLEPVKDKVIKLSFQNIDHKDGSVTSFAWGCVLLVQENYEDWNNSVDLQKSVLPKIYNLLRNGLNHNASIIGPNLLPFFSKLYSKIFAEKNFEEICRKFFSEFKQSLTTETENAPPLTSSELNDIIRSYFECVRYLLQKLNNVKLSDERSESLSIWLVKDNLFSIIIWFIERKTTTSTKFYFQELSNLIAFWTNQLDNSNQNASQLVEIFWKCIYENIVTTLRNSDVCEIYLDNLSVMLQELFTTSEHNCEAQKDEILKDENALIVNEDSNEDANVQSVKQNRLKTQLRKIATELGQLYIQISCERNSMKYIKYLRHLMHHFNDADFCKSLSIAGTMTATLDDLKSLFQNEQLDEETCEILINIIFEILQNFPSNERFTYIETILLKKEESKSVKILILERLLSYQYCSEPAAVRKIFAHPDISCLIIEVTNDAIFHNAMDKYINFLRKCFLQAETGGEILINRATVDGILKILCKGLREAEQKNAYDACGRLLAETMAIFCNGNNASENVKNDVFLNLFEITIKHVESNDYISDDTLSKITTCWQDTLSSADRITFNSNLLHESVLIVQKYINSENLKKTSLIDKMADALAKLILCSTKHIKVKEARLAEIDVTLSTLFKSIGIGPEKISKLENFCITLEATKCSFSIGRNESIDENCLQTFDMESIFKIALLNLSTLKKLICNNTVRQTEFTEQEEEKCSMNDYCDINDNDLFIEGSDLLLQEIMNYINIAAIGDSIAKNNLYPLTQLTEELVKVLGETAKTIMSHGCNLVSRLCEKYIENTTSKEEKSVKYCRVLPFFVNTPDYARFEENATIILHESLCNRFIEQGAYGMYLCFLQYLLPDLCSNVIAMQNPIMQCDPSEVWIKAAMFRCLIKNNFDNVSSNDTKDKTIALAALQFITDVFEKNQNNKEFFLYNMVVNDTQFSKVANIVEFINLLKELIEKFPYQLTLKNWDAVRLGLSSWILSISKSITYLTNATTFLFVARVFRLYEELKIFFINEKQKSSTTTVMNVIDEWENLFAREVDLVLFKVFLSLCDEYSSTLDNGCYALLMEQVVPAIKLIDFNFIYRANEEKDRLNTLCDFLLNQLSKPLHSVRTCCAYILYQMTPFFVAEDILNLEKDSESYRMKSTRFHFLECFNEYITRYGMPLSTYLNEFSFKLSEINEFSQIDRNEGFSYLLLWNCIIHACANSPVSVRSIYTSWIHEKRFEENFLKFLFRAMPLDILRNHDAKQMSCEIFRSLDFDQIQDPKFSIEKFACQMYTEILRKLPALVRKWWNACPSRQKTFIDKLTTNYVSSLICSEELKTIANRKEKYENMQVTVHISTREVLAVYSIDEARMDLVITLPHNYPLGAVKVECGKQIGGRNSARNVAMQLSIFLTQQNGTICDGLTLWKGNLDKKFEGVEECYICYTVIHQDTCQLPKLSCKTCKKKFHGPCLYKWFTTSSKSTCPICRNVF